MGNNHIHFLNIQDSNTSNNFTKIPEHLRQYIVDQKYDNYSPIDHAIWRYVMRINKHFFKAFAHPIYLDGLLKTGISIDRIPRIEEMNHALQKIGWLAVCVDGFIPSKSFMEFQALQILPIAADIRHYNHIGYTPSPDIIHEAAGHAPIIADKDYANYLKLFGEIGQKAIFYPEDIALYEAIRHLSFVKEKSPQPKLIKSAELAVKNALKNITNPSEANLLMRLHWWTVEYGLIGTLDKPKIYGAGLLSSVDESRSCLTDFVTKLPLTIDCIHFAFDITKEQPQLFVAENFESLTEVLSLFSHQMAYKQGGEIGLKKAIKSQDYCTIESSNGIQLSGIFTSLHTNNKGEVTYVKGNTPIISALNNQEINRFNAYSFCDGFEFPIGEICDLEKPLNEFTEEDFLHHHFIKGKNITLRYESGIKITGILKHYLISRGKVSQINLLDCFIYIGSQEYYKGDFTFPIIEDIKSVYASTADPKSIQRNSYVSEEKFDTVKNKYSDALHQLYTINQSVRNALIAPIKLKDIIDQLHLFPEDWLLRLETLENLISFNLFKDDQKRIQDELNLLARNRNLAKQINDGIQLLISDEKM